MATVIRRPARRGLGRVPQTTRIAGVLLLDLAIAIALLAILLLAGDGPVQPGPATVQVGASDAGSTVRLRPGDMLKVTLEGNSSTGYAWEITTCDTAVLLPRGEQEFTSGSSALGSGGTMIARFDAIDTGRTALEMVYRRPFEKDVPPIQSFALSIVIEE